MIHFHDFSSGKLTKFAYIINKLIISNLLDILFVYISVCVSVSLYLCLYFCVCWYMCVYICSVCVSLSISLSLSFSLDFFFLSGCQRLYISTFISVCQCPPVSQRRYLSISVCMYVFLCVSMCHCMRLDMARIKSV